MQTTETRTIAGRELSLVPGRRYLASRPMHDGRKLFPVFVHDVTDGIRTFADDPAAVLEAMPYDEANEILAAFNDGPTSFDGRVW